MDKGKLTIERIIKTSTDRSFQANGEVLIRFTNRGTTRVWIDEDEVLDPGESYTEGDITGPGILHKYKFKFLAAPKAIAVDDPKVYNGDRVHIRTFKRM